MVVSKSVFFSYCYIILVTVLYGFSFTKLDIEGGMHDFLLILALISAIAAIACDNYYANSFLKMVVIALLGMLVYFSSHETLLIIMIFFAIMIKNVGYYKALNLIFKIRLIMFFIIIFCVLIGYLDIGRISVSKGIYGNFEGYGFGYSHPNNLAQEIFYLSTLYLCIKNEKIKNINLFFLLIIDCITYLLTGSKSVCILLILFVFILFAYKNFNDKNIYKKYSRFCLILSILLPILSVAFPILFINSTGKIRKFLYLLNGKINQRISNSTMLFYSFPITLFGKIINLKYLKIKYGYNVVDNGYTFLLFNFGIVGFLLVIYLYYCTMKIFIQKNQVVYFSVITMILCLATMENVLRAPFMNFCMIFWWEAISKTFSKFDDIGGRKNDSKENTLYMARKKQKG